MPSACAPDRRNDRQGRAVSVVAASIAVTMARIPSASSVRSAAGRPAGTV